MFAARNMIFAGVSLDPLTVAFKAASGATDVSGIDAIVRYVRAEGLISSFRLYPMKSAQNAGSGSTVHGIGSLTANNFTLVGSPTWGASGIAMNGSTQYATASDFLAATSRYYFARITPTSATLSALNGVVSHGNLATGGTLSATLQMRATASGSLNANSYEAYRSSDGDTNNPTLSEIYGTATNSITAADQTLVGYSAGAASARSIWRNKTLLTTTLNYGTPQSSIFNSAGAVAIGARLVSGTYGNFLNGTATAVMFYENATDLTTTQRETITDLINAL
tara:strand:+ start:925 stop:1764 length:840 start_codon:yes stop_codon:yes gene_type:complete